MVADVVPPLPGDTQALSSWFVVLSVLIPSLAAGSGSALAFRRARPALAVAAPVAVAVVIGVVSAAVADGIAGLGNYAAIAGVVALFSLAVAAPTAVLARPAPVPIRPRNSQNGRKELVALADGYRESAESWADLLRDCARRGMRAPVLAIGDGALGFWKAAREVFPQARASAAGSIRSPTCSARCRSPRTRARRRPWLRSGTPRTRTTRGLR